MSLDYDLTEIKKRSVHFPPNTENTGILGTLNLKVNSAIWSCIAVQIGTITEANADEWYDRYVFWNRLNDNQPADSDTGGYSLTREDVHHLIGLRTNVFPDMDRPAWLDRLFRFSQEGRIW